MLNSSTSKLIDFFLYLVSRISYLDFFLFLKDENILLHPSYFPSIEQMAAVAQAEKVVFEVEDNYQSKPTETEHLLRTATAGFC